jgi:prepilin peptidase CpaA
MPQALHILDQVSVVAFAALALLAALGDWSRFTIPNRLSLAIVGLWAVHALLLVAQGRPLLGVAWAVVIALVVFLIGFAMFAAGLLGGGDVKMLSAATLWAAPDYALPFILIVTVSGALLGLAFLVPGLGNRPPDPAADDLPVDPTPSGTATQRLGRKMPYGLAIAVGCVSVTLHLLSAGG